MSKTNFAARLRAAIEKRKVSVSELAGVSGMTRAAIYYLLNGDRTDPPWSTVCALAEALQVKTDYFRR